LQIKCYAAGMDPLSQLIDQEDRARLHSAISNLPDTERLVTRMRSLEDFSESDTAACLNLPAAKVRRCLSRARELLRRRLL